MKRACTLCGCSYGGIYAFKAGHVCENCVKIMKSNHRLDIQVRTDHQ